MSSNNPLRFKRVSSEDPSARMDAVFTGPYTRGPVSRATVWRTIVLVLAAFWIGVAFAIAYATVS